MPYTGPNGYQPYVPPPNLQQYGSRGMLQQNGQAQAFQRTGQAPYPQQHAHQAPTHHIPAHPSQQQQYRPPSNFSQTAYTTPQFYGQPQPTSFYQTPSPSIQYQQPVQQPYLSPSVQNAPIQDYRSYSPDPLQGSFSPQQQYQPRPQQQARYGTSQTVPTASPQQQSAPSPQWTNYARPHSGQNVTSAAPRGSQHSPQPQQQRPSSQQRPQPDLARSHPGQVRQSSTTTSQRPPSQQHASVNQARHSSQLQQSTPPSTSRPGSGNSAQAQPQQPSAQQLPQTVNPANLQAPVQRYQGASPDVSQQRVAHVQVPVHRAQHSPDDEMARSSKRRKSNDGQSVPVCETPAQPHLTPQVKKPVAPSVKPAAAASTTAKSTSKQTSLDYQPVLLALSDEYIKAAYSMTGALSTAEVSEEALDTYHALLSTGMGCLETIIRNYHVSDPRKEARIRLRLASLLYEETDNDMETEEILSKGITICERARLVDLKYSMHHLLVRVWFKGQNARAAIKAVEKLIVDVEKLGLLHWVYAFRFLRVSIGLQAEATHAEYSALVKHLQAIQDMGSRNYHVPVQLVAATLEALVHLRSRTPESVDLAQRAMAGARTHQLSQDMAAMPQIRALLDCIDLACNLQNFEPNQASTKTEIMQRTLDSSSRDSTWSKDGTWQVPLCGPSTTSSDIASDTGGLMKQDSSGAYVLTFNWLTLTQLYILGFLFSGLATLHKNAGNEHKAEEYFGEGIKLSNAQIEAVPMSISAASAQYNQQRLTRMILRLYVVFGRCGRADWAVALKGIGNIRKDVRELEFDLPEEIACLVTYLEGVCNHGLGDLAGAMKIYRSDDLSLGKLGDSRPVTSTTSPIKVLAALNSIPIMRFNGDIEESERLVMKIQDFCVTSKNGNGNVYGNKALESALFALRATDPLDSVMENITIIKTKQFLQSAVQAAKNALNNQLLCLVMNLMTNMFFKNIVGDQAEKSVRAGRSLAKKSSNTLWIAVADQMYAETLERCGKLEEAAAARHSAQEAMHALPDSLRAALASSGMAGNGFARF